MKNSGINIGDNNLKEISGEVKGEMVTLGNEEFYCIRNYNLMAPFLMSIVSNSNHWMYLSSLGGLTAGRINPDNALFPYYTDDKVHDSSANTGSKTILRVMKNSREYLWEPFSLSFQGIYNVSRNLYKNIPGNKVMFEEVNTDLGVVFRYSWLNSDRFGWVKKSEILNSNGSAIHVNILDGFINILPYGITRQTQAVFSTLMDAYKKTELVPEAGLALYRMSSIPVDRAEPSESLKVTTVWATGLYSPLILLSTSQLDAFRQGKKITGETGNRGIRGAFMVNTTLKLSPGLDYDWIMVAETGQDATDVQELVFSLRDPEHMKTEVLEDVETGTENLRSIVSGSDGIQECADKLVSGRHFSNVLFNVMRGGLFSNGYVVDKHDFILHLGQFNKDAGKRSEQWVSELGESVNYSELLTKAEGSEDPDLYRLTLEYLPLSFSRRHGDPSRPWNIFSINIKKEDGSPSLYYQGNWRDIFQNWEALAMSYPLFTGAMICKFLNASTADGYNPYRISREGFDWEIHDPSDPWSNIGYWGDHQVIYLLKLLELSDHFFPGELESWMGREMFVYANVPYRIKPFSEILKNPRDSIVFDDSLNSELLSRFEKTGSDGKLVTGPGRQTYRVNLVEKLLVSILSKLSNFIPGAGIWMNTQRPDWNDANNALTGYGVSMVTLYHLRRHLEFLDGLMSKSKTERTRVSAELKIFFEEVNKCFTDHKSLTGKNIDDIQRKKISYLLGESGSRYREKIYAGFSAEKTALTRNEILDFLRLSGIFIDNTIRANRRPDGLYHSYNLLTIKDDRFMIRNLYEMLEGQVSVLGSGFLDPKESLDLLDSLRKSKMYREDQNSYTLYPDRNLPLFVDKNIIPDDEVAKSTLLRELLKEKNKEIIVEDIKGHVHFNSSFNNASALRTALLNLGKKRPVNESQVNEVLDIYERVFDHQSFTGRSGTFFKYEGLGCIYWHMVSKLLLSTGEIIQKAYEEGASPEIIKKLKSYYREIGDGIGLHKNPADYGAFTTDPYSHTPSMMGAQQPGMTGQVKEDILCRWLELGLKVQNGQISIQPQLLREQEFLNPGVDKRTMLPRDPYLKFTFCGAVFKYMLSNEEGITIHYESGETSSQDSFTIDRDTTGAIISRSGHIKKVEVRISGKGLD